MPKHSGSLKKTSLSSIEQYELSQWLKDNRINASNLRRSFTDVHPLARLMLRHFPRLIDLNYYPPRNSVQNKLCNWESFNKRVLARLNLHLTREQMVRVARSVPGSVDLLLYSVMRIQKMAERRAQAAQDSSAEQDDDDEASKPGSESQPVSKTPAKAMDSVVGNSVARPKDKTLKMKRTEAAGHNKRQRGSKDLQLTWQRGEIYMYSSTDIECPIDMVVRRNRMHTISSKSLSNEEIAEVHKWLQQNEFNASRIRREFSDVLPLAEMMKRDYPRLVDLNNFPKRSSVQRKVANWEAFNYKVLSKFNLQMNPEFILLLATGAHGAAEVLLSEIMRVKKRQRVVESRNAILAQEQIWEENDEVKTVIVNKQVGDGIVQVPQKMILYSLYENMARDNQAKDLIIETNRKRLAHMENIIKVKTERIDELLIQVGKSPTNKPQVSPRSSFTSRLASTSLLSYEALGCTRKRHPNTPVSSD
ncbi:uncharacterized protein LOC6565860 [Drosophila grimshawi]|nr:uncharacterized protein LOC6565860 [Drosophila grimshawi]